MILFCSFYRSNSWNSLYFFAVLDLLPGTRLVPLLYLGNLPTRTTAMSENRSNVQQGDQNERRGGGERIAQRDTKHGQSSSCSLFLWLFTLTTHLVDQLCLSKLVKPVNAALSPRPAP